MKKQPIVSLKGITKSFGQVVANEDISLDIYAGKIKGLLGENGAGKSTLMSILAGRLMPDKGQILIQGKPRIFHSAKDAINAGIGMVYQHFMLIDAMTVAENIFLGQEGGAWLRPKEMTQKVNELAKKYGLEIDPQARVSSLSMGEKQRVEILKLLFRNSQVLIFDEPTAVLTSQETTQLFAALKEMAGQGKAIVFISHKLEEVMDLVDEVAILRKGHITAQMDVKDIKSKEDLALEMVGREVLLEVEKKEVPRGERVLHIHGLNSGRLKDVHLDVHRGEILGLVGVAGNGQKPLVEIICGLSGFEQGKIEILGQDWPTFYKFFPRNRSLSYIPEDRLGLATCPGLDLTDNFLLTTRKDFSSGPWLLKNKARQKAADLIRRFNVLAPGTKVRARQLSGGNLQKMVLAREFYRHPLLIVAEQPTQGLDIAATEDVWRLLLEAKKGAGVLLVTGDINEALTLSDRIAVIFDGQIMDIFPVTDRFKVENIGLLMAGVRPENQKLKVKE